MPSETQSLESLFSQLTSFSLGQDAEFRRGENDFITRTRKVGRCVGTIYDEALTREVSLYDEKTIAFTAERVPSPHKHNVSIIGRFILKLETLTHVDSIPPTIRSYIDPDMIDVHDTPEPGDLAVSLSVEYIVERPYDQTIDITRDMAYTFYGNGAVLYETSEGDETGKFEQVPIAHEQKTLLVRRPVQEEAVADVSEQLQFNVLFDDMFDGKNIAFYTELLAAREQDAALAIRAMLRSFKTGAETPEI